MVPILVFLLLLTRQRKLPSRKIYYLFILIVGAQIALSAAWLVDGFEFEPLINLIGASVMFIYAIVTGFER